jgi:hypothetical protein
MVEYADSALRHYELLKGHLGGIQMRWSARLYHSFDELMRFGVKDERSLIRIIELSNQ